MDMRTKKWYASLVLGGDEAMVTDKPDSLTGLIRKTVEYLIDADGDLTRKGLGITLTLAPYPLTQGVAGTVLAEVQDITKPLPGETAETWRLRLEDFDLPGATLDLLSREYFPQSNPGEIAARMSRYQQWINDSRAMQWLHLSTNSDAFLAAPPGLYESLNRYVHESYPEFAANIPARLAR